MDKRETLFHIFERFRIAGIVKTQKEFANILEVNDKSLSLAMNGNEKYLTDSFIKKVKRLYEQTFPGGEMQPATQDTLPVIPTEAMAGTLGEFAESVKSYDCERMISPIKGVDYAIKVCGDSMTPEIPNGCHILIKKVWEEAFIEWGKIYCLDTQNGAIIKKVYPTDNPDVIECRSINPAYPPFTIHTKYINGWYRILMVMALK